MRSWDEGLIEERSMSLCRRGIKKPARRGDCFEAAGRYVSDHFGEKGLVLVHGEVEGSEGGEIEGLRYGHAWVEEGNTVIEVANGNHLRIPKALYYLFGKVGKTHRYAGREALEMMLSHGHYGPWELKTESGL